MKFQCAEWQDKREIEKSMLMIDDDDDDDDDEMMMKRWICTGKNPLHLFRVRECQDLCAECFK